MLSPRNLVNALKRDGISILLVVSLALNAGLAWKLKRAREANWADLGLAVGERAPEFRARDLNGRTEQIRYGAAKRGTLIYYFSPQCGWCKRNAANFRALAARLAPDYQVVSYTADLTGVQKYLEAAHHEAHVVTDDDADIRRTLKLTGTPETILVSPSGRVVKNWEGAYSGATQREIESYFGVRLPGIAQWQTAAEAQHAGF
jgi:peroxiredoxin